MTEARDQLYEGWHEQLGHREYRVTVTMAGYGNDPADAEAFLEGFLAKHPEFGPVVAQDAEADTITVTFSLMAKDPDHAFSLGRVVFADGGAASGLPAKPATRIELEPVAQDEAPTGDHASLQPIA